MMKIKYIFSFLLLLCLVGFEPVNYFNHVNNEQFGSQAWLNKQINITRSQASNIDTNVLKLALTAYVNARRHGLDKKELLTVIDYSKPSTERRLWVVDLKNEKVLFNTWVSHGKNSGQIHATSFSNRPGSLKSSIGVFITRDSYIGGNGYSLRLAGLEHGINDNAYKRDIVVHGAWYVNPSVIRKFGQIGRSWGCPAVGANTAKPLIDAIKDKTLVMMYYPDRKWLRNSTFLAG